MTGAPDATGDAGARIIDIELFRRDRSIDTATISTAVADAAAAAGAEAHQSFPRRLGKGDKVLDRVTREVGMIIRVPEDRRSRFIVSFPWGRRAVFASQVELWDGDDDARSRAANPAGDREPDLFGPDVIGAVRP